MFMWSTVSLHKDSLRIIIVLRHWWRNLFFPLLWNRQEDWDHWIIRDCSSPSNILLVATFWEISNVVTTTNFGINREITYQIGFCSLLLAFQNWPYSQFVDFSHFQTYSRMQNSLHHPPNSPQNLLWLDLLNITKTPATLYLMGNVLQ